MELSSSDNGDREAAKRDPSQRPHDHPRNPIPLPVLAKRLGVDHDGWLITYPNEAAYYFTGSAVRRSLICGADLPVKEIQPDAVYVRTLKGNVLRIKYRILKNLVRQLDGQFFQLHQSYVINLHAAREITTRSKRAEVGAKILGRDTADYLVVARRRLPELRRRLGFGRIPPDSSR